MASIKHVIKKIITGFKPFLNMIDSFSKDMPRVLVYHRFAPPGRKIPHRVSADEFAWQLDMICRDFRVTTFAEYSTYFKLYGTWPKKTIVLTIDDGYRDMYDWAYPELVKRNLPATFFVTTRFIDGDLWLWPDRLLYAINNTTHQTLSISAGDSIINFTFRGDHQKLAAWKRLSEYCISISNANKENFIQEIENKLEVSLSLSPPPEYSASTWSELREMQNNGIEIGSHTMNHPILSKIPPTFLHNEIYTSKQVIENRLGRNILTFCYPNSAPPDINDVVVSTVKEAGYIGAVFGSDLNTWDPYRVPRMGISNDRSDFLWKIYGGEYINNTLHNTLT